MPTYANITELRQRAKVLNLDPSLSDHELREQAKGMNLIAEDELPAKLAELRRDAKSSGHRNHDLSGQDQSWLQNERHGRNGDGCGPRDRWFLRSRR